MKLPIEQKNTEQTNNTNRQSNKANGVKKPINKCDLGIDFVPPDGGWGWLVVIAAGASNLLTFPVLQQFGLLFKQRLESIGVNASQMTTIINMNQCLTSCVGLINGPMFRRFTYRQVGLFGAFLIAFAVYLTSVSNSFLTYLLTFSILYGTGTGINQSANSLALNTYFKKRRRIATGLSWTITGMGPIIMPQVIAVILPYYGLEVTLWLYTGFALIAVACALIYQPVQWHVKKVFNTEEKEEHIKQLECDYCAATKHKGPSIFSPEYLYNADNASVTGYEICDPGTPMLSIANDGWSFRHSQHGSRASLYSNRPSRVGSRITSSQNLIGSQITSSQNLVGSNRPSSANLHKERDRRKEKVTTDRIAEDEEEQPVLRNSLDKNIPASPTTPTSPTIPFRISIGPPSSENQVSTNHRSIPPSRKISRTASNTFNFENEVLKGASRKLEELVSSNRRQPTFTNLNNVCTCDELRRQLLEREYFGNEIDLFEEEEENERNEEKNMTLWDKIVIFFDLDLLRDISFVNLMVGVTFGAFAEMNFSILTPFILSDWGFQPPQIATAMSLLGAIDISMRFFVPFIAGKIGWENKTFFLFGIMGMALGRIYITFFHSYESILIAFCWIGVGKGLRTVFMALVIPSYVPLHRLPAASGLQLLFAGFFYLIAGPLVGLIRDKTNYIVTMHCLNILTFTVAICWTCEKIYWMRVERRLLQNNNAANEVIN